MTAGNPSDGDPAGAAFLDDEERAEADWLLARERDPASPPPSAAVAAEYAALEGLLGDLPDAVDERWHDDVLRQAAALPVRGRWRKVAVKWAIGAAVAAAAAAVALLVLYPSKPAELEIAIRHAGESRGSREVVVGDHLVVTARPGGGAADLRVYRAPGVVVARCPGGPACVAERDGELVIDVVLDAPVQYQIILVVGASAPAGAAMDAYLEAARAANARIVVHPPIDVH